MVTRIRYSKDKTNLNLLISNKPVLFPNGQLVQIQLDTETNTYSFVVGNEVISQGRANSLLNLKKLVRSTLLEVGVPLEVEVKNFKKTEVAA